MLRDIRPIKNRACGEYSLTNESFRSWLHANEIIRHEKELDCCLVWILDDDLELPLFWDPVGSASRTPR
jgi:hypothetical protein